MLAICPAHRIFNYSNSVFTMLKFNTHLFSVCAPILQDISGLLNEKFVEHLCGMGSIFTMIIDK
jgi:hypothetical protein